MVLLRQILAWPREGYRWPQGPTRQVRITSILALVGNISRFRWFFELFRSYFRPKSNRPMPLSHRGNSSNNVLRAQECQSRCRAPVRCPGDCGCVRRGSAGQPGASTACAPARRADSSRDDAPADDAHDSADTRADHAPIAFSPVCCTRCHTERAGDISLPNGWRAWRALGAWTRVGLWQTERLFSMPRDAGPARGGPGQSRR